LRLGLQDGRIDLGFSSKSLSVELGILAAEAALSSMAAGLSQEPRLSQEPCLISEAGLS